MQVFSRPGGECCLLVAALLTTTYFAKSQRMISYFEGADPSGLLFSTAITSTGVLYIEYNRYQNDHNPTCLNLIKKCAATFFLSLIATTLSKLSKERITLSFKPAFKLSCIHIGAIAGTHTLLSLLASKKVFQEDQYRLTSHPLYLTIDVSRSTLKENPKEPIQHLAASLKTAAAYARESFASNPWIKPTKHFPQIYVKFTNELVADEGGGTREYLDDLFQTVSKFPFSTEQSDLAFFENVGEVLMAFYHSPTTKYAFSWGDVLMGMKNYNYYIGHHLNLPLFEAAISLTAEEINTPYKDLSKETKLKIAAILLSEDSEAAFYRNMIHWIQNFDSLTEVEVEEMTKALAAFDITMNLENLEKFFFDSEKGDAAIASLHALAKGMKTLSVPAFLEERTETYWNTVIRKISPLDFCDKVQGSLDREEINKRFVLDESLDEPQKIHIENRLNWIKEWILNEATETELKQFLKFMTGSSSCPPQDVKITVSAQGFIDMLMGQQGFSPVPTVSTCEFYLRLAPQPSGDQILNDHTKENFILCLKAAISGESFFSTF